MIITACVDEAMGLQFAGRRQSRDRVMVQTLLTMAEGSVRISPFSEKLFEGTAAYCGADYLTGAKAGDWCFCEDCSYLNVADQIEKIVLFQWNRTYPADLHFQFPGQWEIESRREFAGSSHDNITIEVYKR